jgi:hypothetical protein
MLLNMVVSHNYSKAKVNLRRHSCRSGEGFTFSYIWRKLSGRSLPALAGQ